MKKNYIQPTIDMYVEVEEDMMCLSNNEDAAAYQDDNVTLIMESKSVDFSSDDNDWGF